MEHPAYSQLRQISQSVDVVPCPNPSYSSLEDTDSYVIKAEGDGRSIVIDLGPEDEGHLNVPQCCAGDVALILLTHRHGDHADGAAHFHQFTGAPIREPESQYCAGGQDPLVDGERIILDGVIPQIEVVVTPGYIADFVCFLIHTGDGEDDVEGIVTGDTIAGRHITMISETNGDLGKYMETLKMLDSRGKGVRLPPGHGADLPNITVMTRKYIERRRLCLQQVKDAAAKLGDEATIDQIVDEICTDVDSVLRHAIEQSTRVTLRYLRDHGEQLLGFGSGFGFGFGRLLGRA